MITLRRLDLIRKDSPPTADELQSLATQLNAQLGALATVAPPDQPDVVTPPSSNVGVGPGGTLEGSGIVLRSHPFYGGNNTQLVMLTKADRIVMHDGQSIEKWPTLLANIGVTGAGGLDTGTEQANSWYEIYAIRKTSDGTRNLLFHRSKAYMQDQAYASGGDYYYPVRNSSNGDTGWAQSFVPSVTGPRHYVDLYLRKGGAPSGAIWVDIYSDNGSGSPGTLLVRGDQMNVANIPANPAWIRFPIRPPYTLTAGTRYHYFLTGTWALDDGNGVGWLFDTTAPTYPGGIMNLQRGGNWIQIGGYDGYFAEVTMALDTPVVMPAGYDQRAHIGYVYNDASSNFIEFWQTGRDYRYRYVPALLVNGTSLTYLPTNIAAAVPPVSGIITAHAIYSDTLNAYITLTPNADGAGYGASFRALQPGMYLECGAELPFEFQNLYYLVSAGTFSVYLRSFRW